MKRIYLIVLLALGLGSCAAQEAEKKLKEAEAKLERSQTELAEARALLDTVKLNYNYEIAQFSSTVRRLEGQIEALEIMLAECPDTALVNDLFRQKARLEIQIANMKIVEQESYNVMLKFQELSDAWLEAYIKEHPDAEFLKE
jgi:DNA-binding FrmR family transcriptional regulator